MDHESSGRLSAGKKTWLIAGLVLGWFIWLSGVFGNSGLLQAYQLSQVRRDMTLHVKALENERQHLQATLLAIENDSLVQESAVRETLGFVRSNELVFDFR